MAEKEVEQITIGEAVGFWQKNKSWILPAIAAIGGILGGANVNKVTPLLPNTGDTTVLVKRLDVDEVRLGIVEAKLGIVAPVPADSSKKNDGSQGSDPTGVIHLN